MKYDEGAAQLLTQQCARSDGSVPSYARQQAGAVQECGTQKAALAISGLYVRTSRSPPEGPGKGCLF
jgi:hypothetical protein